MKTDYGILAREIIAACIYARTTQLTWLLRRGLTLEQARRLSLTERKTLQAEYAREANDVR